MSVTIVTTCKGRLDFLRQTLPAMVATGFPVTVVDFDCPQDTAGFLAGSFPDIHVAVVKDRPIWHATEARNIGARTATGDFLLFIDSDVVLDRELGRFLATRPLSPDEFFVGAGDIPELWGQCLIPRHRFNEIGGYDEAIVGWGYEDQDLFEQLKLKNLAQLTFPPGLLTPLPHPHSLRTQFSDEPNMLVSLCINHVYSRVKRDIEGILHASLPLDRRRALQDFIARAVRTAVTQADRSLTFEVPLAQVGAGRLVTPAWRLDQILKYTIDDINMEMPI